VDEWWWDPAQARRSARAQVLLDQGRGSDPEDSEVAEPRALLLVFDGAGWNVEGVYE
jgi:protein ImuB